MTKTLAPAFLGALAALSLLVAAPDAHAQGRTRLTVYSTLELDQLNVYKRTFEAAHPGIEIAFLKDSTGVVTARILAEKDAPQADVVWGLAVTSMILLDEQGLLLPYAPKNLAAIKPSFRDPKPVPSWVGIDAWVAALCFNTAEAARRGLKKPESWQDLLDPAWKGQIVMPNPSSSGTGYFHVSAWLQMMGEEKGWAYLDALDKNIAIYVHSGTKPCRMAANGEFAVGISYELAGATAKQQGAPIEPLLMKEGGGWDMDATAILKGARNLEAAKVLADWSASREANVMYSKNLAVVAIEGIKSEIPGYPLGVEQSMIRNDFAWAAANRQRILDEWRRRFDAKSEPK